MSAETVEHRPDAAGRDPTLRRQHGQSVREEAEPGDVVEVGMADEGVLDLDLFGGGKGSADRSRVHQDPVVDEES